MKKMHYLMKGWQLLLVFLYLATSVFADVEPNNDIATAEPLALSTVATGDIAVNPANDEDDYYAVVLPANGILTADLTVNDGMRAYIRIYNSQGSQITASSVIDSQASLSAYCLAADTYYVRVDRYDGAGGYALQVTASTPEIVTDTEENNTLETAEGFYEEGDAINGHLGYSGQFNSFFGTDSQDYFTIITAEDGNVTLTAEFTGNLRAYLRLYTTSGEQIAVSGPAYTGLSTTAFCRKADTLIANIDLYDGCGSYSASFSVSELANANDAEPNNSIAEIINTYNENEAFSGHIGYYDNNFGIDGYDYYYLIAPEDGDVTFTAVMDSSGRIYASLYGKNGSYYGTSGVQTGIASVTVGCVAGDTLIGIIDHYDGCGSYSASFDVAPPIHANDLEPNNVIGEINTIVQENQTFTGHIGYYDTDTGTDGYDYYYLIAPEDGDVTFTAVMDSAGRIYANLYGKNGAYYGSSGVQTGIASVTVSCVAGDTLIGLIDHYDGCGSYSASFDVAPPIYANDSEPNNAVTEINTVVQENQTVTGHIGYYDTDTGTDGYDYYYLIAPEDGDVTFTAVMDSAGRIYANLYDKNGSYYGSSGVQTGIAAVTVSCVAGDTLIGLIYHYDGCGSYSASFDVMPPTYANDLEPNNTIGEAITAANFETNYGHLGYYDLDTGTDGYDFYEISVAETPFDLEAKIDITGTLRAYLRLYNSAGSQLAATGLLTPGESSLTYSITTAGTYFIAVDLYDGCGSYSLGDFCGSPPTVAAAITGPETICPGEETTLQATPGLQAYQWIYDGMVVGTAAQLTVDQPGQYFVLGFDGNSCAGTSEVLTIDMFTTPALGINADGPTAFCAGGSVMLTASAGFATYDWSNGDTGMSVTVSEPGTYSVTGTTANGCMELSETIEITVYPIPGLSIAADGPTEVCEGSTVGLSTGDDFASYLWSTGETGNSITASESGDYFVTGTTFDGCTAVSNVITVTISSAGECTPDCFGVPGGNGVIDDCGACRNGVSDPLYNTSCLDCNGEVNGTAFYDNCGTCVGGSTGLEACNDDCFGVPGGDGIYDDCGECRHGLEDPLYNSSCLDCNGDPNGAAFLDNCGICVGGNTGLEPCENDCFGIPGGDGITDDCGECRHGVSDPLYNSTCADCEGIPNGPAQPGTACNIEGQDGIWNSNCECEPEVTGCNAYRYFLSSTNAEGETDIFELFLDNTEHNASMVYLESVDVPVSIAYDGDNELLYLVYQNSATYRTLDVSMANGALGAEFVLNTSVNGFSGAAFGPDGLLYAASESAQRIYAHDPQTLEVFNYSHAAVAGGDIAFGENGLLYLVSEMPRKSFEVISGGSNNFLGYVLNNTSGLALMENDNFLLSVDHKKGLMVGTAQGSDTGIRYRYHFMGGDYFPGETDLASGCAGMDAAMMRQHQTPSFEEASRIELNSSPNPTSGISTVEFTTTASEKALLEVYDLSGRSIARLFEGQVTGGENYRFDFDGSSLPNGVYIYRLTTEKGVEIEKLLILH